MMPRMRRFFLLGVLTCLGCGTGEPTCGLPVDATGRLVVYCDNPRENAVCDEPGMEARYESGAMGFRLVGGRLASCDASDEVICPVGTEGPPYCVLDPEL